MNSHAEIRKLLSSYCGGDLPLNEQTMVEEHLKECPLCREELADLLTMLKLVRTTPEVEPPPLLTARIMAHLREEQAVRPGWLKRFFFPMHIKIPLEIMALLLICTSGYFMSRTVESDLKQGVRQQLEEKRDQQAPVQAPAPVLHPAGNGNAEQSTALHPQTAIPPAAPPKPAPSRAPDTAHPPLSAPPAPAPAAPDFSSLHGSKAESMTESPAAEPYSRTQEAAPKMNMKRIRSAESNNDALPAAAGRAAGAPAGPSLLPHALVRLNMNNLSEAPAMIREAVLRSGGNIAEMQSGSEQRLTVRIPAARQQELLTRLELLGRIVERPTLPAGAELLELTIRW